MPEQANLLRHAASPYLLQHADNPVHWRTWGDDALAEARATNRPILLSIGYAACHWCHVMAHESFENAETAALMNALYVNIKVDREERPDIDHLYMSALHALGEHGGWPLTMFLTPDAVPFWGGTYFPPEPRWGKPSFRQVLESVAEAFHAEAAAVRHNTAALTRTLAAIAAEHPGPAPGPALLDRAAATLLRATDPDRGGLKGAPKFPNTPVFRFLWHEAFRTNNGAAAAAVHHLLFAMSQGGIYDHLGGGYARYATDADWLVPHFEKMLYDNAQILDLLALAHAAAPDPLTAARAAETVGWLLRDMTAETVNGAAAFAASEDADSQGEEGKFYVWTETEIDALLGPAALAFKAAYDVTAEGNWEGRTILRRIAPPGDAAHEAALAAARATLFAARAQRVRPGRDDKVLADWNGLAIAALVRAAAVFARPDWLDRAAQAFAFLDANLSTADGRIAHAWRAGRITAHGLLDDQAACARAALALYQSTADPSYLTRAIALVQAAATWFIDETPSPRAGENRGEGEPLEQPVSRPPEDPPTSYFTTASDAPDVPLGPTARPRSIADDATPNANALMAEVLARLHHLTGEPLWRTRAEAVLAAFGGLADSLVSAPTLLAATDFLENAAAVVITGPADDPLTDALRQTALAAPDPAVAVLRASTAAALPSLHPAHGKPTDRSAAYLCRAGACGLPLTDPAALIAALRSRAA